MKTVAIHQPNFFPWLGYWCKLAAVDVFIFNDSCNLAHPVGFTQRVALYDAAGTHTWLSVPVSKSGAGPQAIIDAQIQTDDVLFKKLLPRLDAHYRRLPHYEVIRILISEAISIGKETNSLASLNAYFIETIAEEIFPEVERCKSSELYVSSTGSQQLIDLINKKQVDCYLSGLGAKDYLDADSFRQNKIDLKWIDSAKMVRKISALTHRPFDESCIYLLSKVGVSAFGKLIRSVKQISHKKD